MRLIDADALKEWAVEIECGGRWGISIDELMDAIEDAPAIDPVKHGNWVSKNGWVSCSVCGLEPPNESNETSEYCPNCGARMDGK